MSVESIDSGTATGGFPEQKENMNDSCEKQQEHESSTVSSTQQTLSTTPAVVKLSEISAPREAGKSARTELLAWANKLDEDELSSLFTIEDVPFLASILALSSWSSSSSLKGQTDRSSPVAGECSYTKSDINECPNLH